MIRKLYDLLSAMEAAAEKWIARVLWKNKQ